MKNILFALLVALPMASQAAIYGNNDLFAVGANTQDVQASAVAIMAPRIFVNNSARTLLLDTQPLSENVYLCKENPMAKLNSFHVSCTGFLIAPDLMVTAGHCMVNFGTAENTVTPQCSDFVWIFDYRIAPNGNVRTDIPSSNMVECEKVIKAVHTSDAPDAQGNIRFDHDFALIKLKTKVNRTPLKVATTPVVARERLSFYGHPLGTGLYRGTGKVLSIDSPKYFRSNIDAFPGHSGAPVLNNRNEVTGILVRGYPESLIDGPRRGCNVYNKCDEEAKSCTVNDPVQRPGEHVQTMTELMKLVR